LSASCRTSKIVDVQPDELTPLESQLWAALAQGRTVEAQAVPETTGTTVRADVVVALLLGAAADHTPGGRPALRLTGAYVTGLLDLRFTEITMPVALTDCVFDEPPLLQGARTREWAMTGCTLPGLIADTAQVDARLVLSGCRVTGPLVLRVPETDGPRAQQADPHRAGACPSTGCLAPVRGGGPAAGRATGLVRSRERRRLGAGP
jgi:hypothetical protein